MKALIVEDEMITALDLESRLEKQGVSSVGIALSSKRAKEMMSDEVDLVFMDVNLKNKECGIELAKELKKHHSFYLIFFSANSTTDLKLRTQEFDHCAFIRKPFAQSDLLRILESGFQNLNSGLDLTSPNHTSRQHLE